MLKPIETVYAGCRFRSRLEARWAVVFETWHVEWEYEPEGYYLDNGRMYLPDFRVKGRVYRSDPIDFYIEVKGNLTEDDKAKLTAFSTGIDSNGYHYIENPILLVGGVPLCSSPSEKKDNYWQHWEQSPDYDWFYSHAMMGGQHCPAFPGVDLWGNFGVFGCGISLKDMDWNKTTAGYKAGRSARFEHMSFKGSRRGGRSTGFLKALVSGGQITFEHKKQIRFGRPLYSRPKNLPNHRDIESFDPDYIKNQEYLFYGDPCGAHDE